jgi:hypothetical protein
MNKGQKKKTITIVGDIEQTKENKGKRWKTLVATTENEQRTKNKSNNNCWWEWTNEKK